MISKIIAFICLLIIPCVGFSQSINIADTYIRPSMMSSSDGSGGSSETYFRFHGNQLDRVNKKFHAYETYTIISKKVIGKSYYYTVKGNNKGGIYSVSILSTPAGKGLTANELIFESAGEFQERYFGF